MDDGPDMDNITSTIGYSMEVSSVMGDDTWHYMETMVVTPDGMKVTIEDNYGEETMISDMIVSGSEVQYSFNNGTTDYQVRMSHEGTTLEAFDAMMNMGLDMDMDMGDDMDSGEMFVCDNGVEIPADYVNDGYDDCDDGSDENGTEGRQTSQITSLDITQEDDIVTIAITGDFSDDPATAPYYTMMLIKNGNDPENALYTIQEEDNYNDWDYLEAGYAEIKISTDGLLGGNYFDVEFSVWLESQSSDSAVSSQFTFYVAESDDNDDHDDHDDGMDMDMEMDENEENPDSGDYTGYFNPVTATFSGYEVIGDEIMFSGLLNVEGAPFGALEVYTTSDFTVTGFSMMDVNDENNWVKFVLINSGETVVDNTLPLSALPFILIDATEFGDGEGEEMDEDMVCYDMDTHEVVDIYDEMDCYDAGYMWTSMDRDENDHDGHDEDREEDMVCYDMDRHVVLEEYDNQMDCEYAGYMWVSSDSGDGHTGENSWSFDRGMEDCDSDNDTMVSYEELVACINNDLANDGFGDMSASDVHADEMFAAYDEDDDTFLNNSEFDNLNSMYSSGEDEAPPTPQELINMTDTDGNGAISFDEFITFWNSPDPDGDHDDNESLPQSMIDELRVIFENNDADQSGELELNELDQFILDTDEYFMSMDGGDDDRDEHHDESYDCMNVTAGDVAPENGTFTFSNGTTVDVEAGYTAPEDGVYCIESHDRDEDNPEEIFAMLDADGDGEVTASEWSDAANNSDEPMGEGDFESLKEMMHMFDDDSSEGLNFAEFEKMMEAMNDDGDNEDDLELIFRMIDSNGDGEVTASEWSDAGNDSEEPMSDEDYQNLAMMISMYDDDNSEGLNFAEFENIMAAMNDDDGEDVMEDMQTIMVMAMVDLHGDLDDYSVTLAYCDDDMNCEDDVYSVKLSDIAVTEDTFFFSGHSVMFIDVDESGTLNSGDMIMIDTSTLDVDEDWNTVRLHSEEANAYSDENPMPGFTGILATIGLLGAALIRRE